ncbi:skp1-like protein 21 [Phtheirospermum japonicum]|uniref:Skp1-like protein 21 n=1 Tax=Phtheirospermum japonicum TaxID=374723 RepID=A0A830C1K8_9LAMI|nr:skp1-like protein 21 [Phtheirospermum japonicum]
MEDFARRLNSDWPERIQQLLFLGQERRPIWLTTNGNGSLRRLTSMCNLCFLLLLYLVFHVTFSCEYCTLSFY